MYYTHFLFQILLQYRFLQDTEFISLCYTVSPCCLLILYIVVYINPKLLIYPSLLSPLVTISLFSMSVFFCFVNTLIWSFYFSDSTYKRYHMIFVFVWLTSLSMLISRSIHIAANGIISFFLTANITLYTCTTSLKKKKNFYFLYLTAPGLSCSMWDPVPWPRIEHEPPALRAWSLSHWTTREVPTASSLSKLICHWTLAAVNTLPKTLQSPTLC